MDLTKYELARLVGARALQLSAGAPPLLKVGSALNFMDVAQLELDKDVIPLVVIREKEL